MSSYSQYTITISNVEHAGKIRINNQDYQIDGDTTIIVKNGSNPWWSDPNFSQGSNMTMYFEFGNGEGQDYKHAFTIDVQPS